MQILDQFKLGQTTRKYMNYLLYIIFLFYMVYLMINETQNSVRIVYLVMLLIIGSGVVLAEVLKIWSVRALTALTQQCDPQAGLAVLERIQKFDLFKGYRQFSLSFTALAMQDLGQPQELLNWLEQTGEKAFSTSPDLRLVYLHSHFRANLMLGQKEPAREYFQATMNLKDRRILGKKVSPLYSWDQIVAEYQYFNGNYKEARKSLAKVDLAHLNPREKAYFDLLDGKICLKEQATGTAGKRLAAVVAVAGKTTLAVEATELMATFDRK